MKTTLKQHLKYSESPNLFMQERWMSLNAFSWKYEFIKPFDYQMNFIKKIHNKNSNFIVKSRQMHVSSMIELYIAWYCIFNYNKKIVIMATSLNSGQNILDHIKTILQNYSVDDMKKNEIIKTYFHWEDDFVINKPSELKLKNGCTIKIKSPTTDACRGESIDFLYIDEAAFIKNFETIWMALEVYIYSNKNYKLIINSTPKNNSAFNKFFINSKDETSNQIILHWSIHPIYSQNILENTNKNSDFKYSSPWFDEIIKKYFNNKNQIEQEFECVVKYEEEHNKIKTISFRIENELYKKIQCKLQEGETSSDYIRKLIEKDIENYL